MYLDIRLTVETDEERVYLPTLLEKLAKELKQPELGQFFTEVGGCAVDIMIRKKDERLSLEYPAAVGISSDHLSCFLEHMNEEAYPLVVFRHIPTTSEDTFCVRIETPLDRQYFSLLRKEESEEIMFE